MEAPLDASNSWEEMHLQDREKIAKILGQYKLQYVSGGKVVGALGTPSRTLEEFIRERDIAAIDLLPASHTNLK